MLGLNQFWSLFFLCVWVRERMKDKEVSSTRNALISSLYRNKKKCHSHIWCNLFWTITRVKGYQGLDSQLLRSCHPSLHSISNWWDTGQSTHTYTLCFNLNTHFKCFLLPKVNWMNLFSVSEKKSKPLAMEYPFKCLLLELF